MSESYCLLNGRCMYMDHIYDQLCKKPVVMEVEGGDSLFASHKVALRLMQAEAAALQRNFSLALRLLKTTREVTDWLVLCGSPNWLYYRTRSSLCLLSILSSDLYEVLTRKQNAWKTQDCCDHSHGGTKQCANFQLNRSKVYVMVRIKVAR